MVLIVDGIGFFFEIVVSRVKVGTWVNLRVRLFVFLRDIFGYLRIIVERFR